MTSPLVSIIIPTYNNGAELRKSIDSAINQSYRHLEILLIDDCSQYKISKRIINQYHSYSNLKVISLPDNKGLGHARNLGITKSKGKYIFFLDADDYLDENCIEKLVNLAEEKKLEVVGCSIKRIKKINQSKVFHGGTDLEIHGKWEVLRAYVDFNVASVVWNKLYRRQLLIDHDIKFREDMYHEDVVFTLKIISKLSKYFRTKESLYFYNVNNRSITSLETSKKHFDSFIKLLLDIAQSVMDIAKNESLNFRQKQILLNIFASHFIEAESSKIVSYCQNNKNWKQDLAELVNDNFNLFSTSAILMVNEFVKNIVINDLLDKTLKQKDQQIKKLKEIVRQQQVGIGKIQNYSTRDKQKIIKKATYYFRPTLKLILNMPRFLVRNIYFFKYLVLEQFKKKLNRHHSQFKLKNKKYGRMAIIDHSYHKKTNSTQFLFVLLKKYFDVDIYYDDSWQGKSKVDLKQIDEKYDSVIFLQVLYSLEDLDKIHTSNIYYIPMFDQIGYDGPKNMREYKDKIKVISFSKHLHKQFIRYGFKSICVQYFPKPVVSPPGDDRSIFFWQRTAEIDLKVIEKLFPPDFHLHLHQALDPNIKLTSKQASTNKLNVTTSQWFENEKSMFDILNRSLFYVAPRSAEGIGMSFLQAMANGRIVVAVNRPTMNEYIKDGVNGFLFDLADPRPLNFDNLSKVKINTKRLLVQGYKKWKKERIDIVKYIIKGEL